MKNKIVLVPFPFDNFTASKVRPALCLTNSVGKYNHVVIAFISSRLPEEKASTDIMLEKKEGTGLKVDSVLRLHRLITVPESIIARQLGVLPKSMNAEVEKKLKLFFGLK